MRKPTRTVIAHNPTPSWPAPTATPVCRSCCDRKTWSTIRLAFARLVVSKVCCVSLQGARYILRPRCEAVGCSPSFSNPVLCYLCFHCAADARQSFCRRLLPVAVLDAASSSCVLPCLFVSWSSCCFRTTWTFQSGTVIEVSTQRSCIPQLSRWSFRLVDRTCRISEYAKITLRGAAEVAPRRRVGGHTCICPSSQAVPTAKFSAGLFNSTRAGDA